MIAWIAGWALLAAGPAFAQEKLCAGTYSHEEWLKAMDTADQQMGQFKLKDARVTIYAAREQVPCLDQLVKPSYLGRYARQVALLEFLSQDEETASRWGELQRVAAPDLPWPADIPEDHPFRELITGLDLPTESGPTDKSLLIPKGGGVFLDGTPILYPQAWSEVPNLLQVADGDGKITSAYWQDGAAFHDEALTDLGKTPKPPKWFVGEPAGTAAAMTLPLVFAKPAVADAGGHAPVVPAPVPVAVAPAPKAPPSPPVAPVAAPPVAPVAANGWSEATAPVAGPKPTTAPPAAPKQPAPEALVAPKPGSVAPASPAVAPKPEVTAPPPPEPEPIAPPLPDSRASEHGSGANKALLGAGVGAIVVGGALYAAAAVSGGGLDNATTEDQLVGVRSRTNGLVVGAGAAGLVGLGLGTTAFLSADGWMLGVHSRF
jgi:hypothetical protein